MSKVKNHRFGLIGLCVTAACALMAFGASAAQAAPPEWMLAGTNISTNTAVTASATFEPITFENGESTETKNVALLLGNTALGPIWIGCEKAEGAVTLAAGGTATGTISFTSCSTSIKQSGHMKLSTVCKPKEPIEAGGKLAIVLHEGVPYAKAEGPSGGNFTTIVIPEGCALEGSYPVAGWALVEDCEGATSFKTEKEIHLIKEAMGPTLTLGGGLTFGAFSTSIDGSGLLKVKQSGLAKNFSGLAA